VIPLALGETWFAVFGGLIPIVGLVLVGLVLWRAVQPPEDEKSRKDEESE
jgi:hypothetical protein